MITEIMTGARSESRARGKAFQILGAGTLEPRVPNEAQTNGADSRLTFERLRERIE